MSRFWVLGPVEMDGKSYWGVVDGEDLPGRRPARKPPGYQEFWPSLAEAEEHRDLMNEEERMRS